MSDPFLYLCVYTGGITLSDLAHIIHKSLKLTYAYCLCVIFELPASINARNVAIFIVLRLLGKVFEHFLSEVGEFSACHYLQGTIFAQLMGHTTTTERQKVHFAQKPSNNSSDKKNRSNNSQYGAGNIDLRAD